MDPANLRCHTQVHHHHTHTHTHTQPPTRSFTQRTAGSQRALQRHEGLPRIVGPEHRRAGEQQLLQQQLPSDTGMLRCLPAVESWAHGLVPRLLPLDGEGSAYSSAVVASLCALPLRLKAQAAVHCCSCWVHDDAPSFEGYCGAEPRRVPLLLVGKP